MSYPAHLWQHVHRQQQVQHGQVNRDNVYDTANASSSHQSLNNRDFKGSFMVVLAVVLIMAMIRFKRITTEITMKMI